MLGKWWTLKTLVSVAVITYALAQQEININEDENIIKAVDCFNSREKKLSVFKQYSYLPAGYQKIVDDLFMVNFLAKETVCPQTQEYNIAECDFSPDGEIELCVTYVSDELDSPNVACTAISENRRRKRRLRLKNFFRNVGKGAKKLLQHITPVITATIPIG